MNVGLFLTNSASIQRPLRRLQRRFRARRMKAFLHYFSVTPDTRILDVGGINSTSNHPGVVLMWNDIRAQVTTFNIREPADVIGDARNMPLDSGSFDVAFCNSLIEHIGAESDQRKCASEIRRVARSYYIQCPNRWFPLEVHWPIPLPLLHWLPRKWFNPSPDSSSLRLLSAKELHSMFPEAVIWRERFFGFTKSIIAVYRP